MRILSEEHWHIDKEHGFVRDEKESPIAYVFGFNSDSEKLHDEAALNARAIAAVPKMVNYLSRYRYIKCGKQCKFLKHYLEKLLDFIDCIGEGTEISE